LLQRVGIVLSFVLLYNRDTYYTAWRNLVATA